MIGLLFGVVARQALTGSRDRETIGRVWRRTRMLHREAGALDALHVRATRPSAGVGLLLRVMRWDRALYAALRDAGDDAALAAGVVERVNWTLVRPGLALAHRVAGVMGGGRLRRVRRVVGALFATVFGRPFARTVRDAPDAVAFDVTRCPLAEYFAARGAPELTRHAACALDYRMADAWGVRLVRTRTIAQGADVCDFRFVALERAHRPASASV